MLYGKTGVSRRAYPIFSRIRGGERVINMIASLRKIDKDEVVVQRMKIIKFYEQYGEIATKEAFGADRKLVSRWKKRSKSSGGKLTSLIPTSTRPVSVRTPQTRGDIVEFIKSEREKHYRIGKEKLKVFLDKYCKEDGIPHFFIYPRCPKIDTYIERYNRSVQEEFIERNDE